MVDLGTKDLNHQSVSLCELGIDCVSNYCELLWVHAEGQIFY